MCGIAGFCLNKDEKGIDAKEVSMAMLNQIVARGEDATGAAWVQYDKKAKKSNIAVSKAPVPAYNFEQYLSQMAPTTTRAILHTRWATKGSPQNNLNNHPIVSGRIVGVHNGVLRNDDAVFSHLRETRKAQVDSEAAFALLSRTVHSPHEVLQSLQGRAALAWLDARDKRDLHLARVDGSPLAIGLTEKGSLFFASTMPLLVNSCADAGIDLKWCEDVEPMTYLKIRNGEFIEIESIGQSLKAIAS
jgi:glucosamine 6-phosphate synthetase-like amidotransferase/phosphosugar isomerase protein